MSCTCSATGQVSQSVTASAVAAQALRIDCRYASKFILTIRLT